MQEHLYNFLVLDIKLKFYMFDIFANGSKIKAFIPNTKDVS
jgi:hypothetical protein